MQITPSARKYSVPVFRLSKSFDCLKKSNFIQSEIKESLPLYCSAGHVTAANVEDHEVIACRNLKHVVMGLWVVRCRSLLLSLQGLWPKVVTLL